MDGATFVILSMALTHGTLLVLALRELWLLRQIRRERDPDPEADPIPPPPDRDRRPLPDCLIPRPLAPTRRSERELA